MAPLMSCLRFLKTLRFFCRRFNREINGFVLWFLRNLLIIHLILKKLG